MRMSLHPQEHLKSAMACTRASISSCFCRSSQSAACSFTALHDPRTCLPALALGNGLAPLFSLEFEVDLLPCPFHMVLQITASDVNVMDASAWIVTGS